MRFLYLPWGWKIALYRILWGKPVFLQNSCHLISTQEISLFCFLKTDIFHPGDTACCLALFSLIQMEAKAKSEGPHIPLMVAVPYFAEENWRPFIENLLNDGFLFKKNGNTSTIILKLHFTVMRTRESMGYRKEWNTVGRKQTLQEVSGWKPEAWEHPPYSQVCFCFSKRKKRHTNTQMNLPFTCLNI